MARDFKRFQNRENAQTTGSDTQGRQNTANNAQRGASERSETSGAKLQGAQQTAAAAGRSEAGNGKQGGYSYMPQGQSMPQGQAAGAGGQGMQQMPGRSMAGQQAPQMQGAMRQQQGAAPQGMNQGAPGRGMAAMGVDPMERNRKLAGAQYIRPVDAEQCRRWNMELQRYKTAKHKLDRRVIESEEWWRLHNEFGEAKVTDGGDADMGFTSKSSWLFNTIAAKHADYKEAYPDINVRARAEADKQDAYMLSHIVPVVLKANRFKRTYDLNGWQKMKTGTAIYKVIWDKGKLNGQGDISIVRRSLLNVYWEPGITDIQDSKYFFDVEMIDRETFLDNHPEFEDKNLTNAVTPEKIRDEDTKEDTQKVAVVEVYYKRRGKVHYAKYVGETVIYATENDNEILKTDRQPMTGIIEGVHTKAADGLYDHGKYPYVFDTLFPVEGSPAGFGYVDLLANTMTRIDELDQALLENTKIGATPRYFARQDGQVNMDEFLNSKKKLVHVQGNIDETAIRLIDTPPISQYHILVRDGFVQELKQTSGNTDAGNGVKQNGITAASAYAAMQEASGKLSRDSTDTTYDACEDIAFLVIELIRQFYDQPRMFRIIGKLGQEQYVSYDNHGMQMQWQGEIGGMDMGYRLPEYDLEVEPEKRSGHSRMEKNEIAMELYGKGFFNPQLTDQALLTLDMMDFDGKNNVMQKVAQNGTMFQQLRQWQQLALQLANIAAPEMVPGLSAAITGQGGNSAAGAYNEGVAQVGKGFGDQSTEPTIVKKARQQNRQSAQPGGAAVK